MYSWHLDERSKEVIFISYFYYFCLPRKWKRKEYKDKRSTNWTEITRREHVINFTCLTSLSWHQHSPMSKMLLLLSFTNTIFDAENISQAICQHRDNKHTRSFCNWCWDKTSSIFFWKYLLSWHVPIHYLIHVQSSIHKGSTIIPILSTINPIPRIDTHLFNIRPKIFLPSTLRPS